MEFRPAKYGAHGRPGNIHKILHHGIVGIRRDAVRCIRPVTKQCARAEGTFFWFRRISPRPGATNSMPYAPNF